jgi:hypothetical protein
MVDPPSSVRSLQTPLNTTNTANIQSEQPPRTTQTRPTLTTLQHFYLDEINKTLNTMIPITIPEKLTIKPQYFDDLFVETDEANEGAQAFIEKRPPDFKQFR